MSALDSVQLVCIPDVHTFLHGPLTEPPTSCAPSETLCYVSLAPQEASQGQKMFCSIPLTDSGNAGEGGSLDNI